MPGVKANTQDKTREKEKVGGGGAAGKAARTGAGAPKLSCTVCKTEVAASAPLKTLTEHTDSKHAKLADAVKVCFPTWVAPA